MLVVFISNSTTRWPNLHFLHIWSFAKILPAQKCCQNLWPKKACPKSSGRNHFWDVWDLELNLVMYGHRPFQSSADILLYLSEVEWGAEEGGRSKLMRWHSSGGLQGAIRSEGASGGGGRTLRSEAEERHHTCGHPSNPSQPTRPPPEPTRRAPPPELP